MAKAHQRNIIKQCLLGPKSTDRFPRAVLSTKLPSMTCNICDCDCFSVYALKIDAFIISFLLAAPSKHWTSPLKESLTPLCRRDQQVYCIGNTCCRGDLCTGKQASWWPTLPACNSTYAHNTSSLLMSSRASRSAVCCKPPPGVTQQNNQSKLSWKSQTGSFLPSDPLLDRAVGSCCVALILCWQGLPAHVFVGWCDRYRREVQQLRQGWPGLSMAINGLGAKVGSLEALLSLTQQRIADKADAAELAALR